MNFLKASFVLAVGALAVMAAPRQLLAQGATEQILLHPPADSWPGYHGDYSGRR
jgi:alcohol dehydrogenase (cytochrome c)